MLELVSRDYTHGRIWNPKNIESRLLLQRLINKDSIKDSEMDTLEFVAEFHGVEIALN